MRKVHSTKYILLVCRGILSVVFILAALGKIADLKEFSDAVAAFKILPTTSVNVFAIVLPWVELLIGLSLLSGTLLRQAAFLSIVLNLIFTVAIGLAMSRGLDIECGCFTLSNAHTSVGWGLIFRDAVLILIALPILRQGNNNNQ